MSFGATAKQDAILAACSVSEKTGAFAPLAEPMAYPGDVVTRPQDIATAVFWDATAKQCITDNQVMLSCRDNPTASPCNQIPSGYLQDDTAGWWSKQSAGGKATLALGVLAGFGLVVYMVKR